MQLATLPLNQVLKGRNKVMKPKIKKSIFSFFSGLGFLDLGFEKNGFDVVMVNEIHKPFLEAYKYSRKELGIEQPKYGYYNCDVRAFLYEKQRSEMIEMIRKEKEDGALVGFIGGPPCPDFSVGGKNKGRLGKNGLLTETYVEMILEFKPDYFVFENVKGLWRTKKHRVFYEEMKKRIVDSGYTVTERLINSIEYGVPQDRDRIIFVGFKNELFDSSAKKVTGSALSEDEFEWNKFVIYDKDVAFKHSWPVQDKFKVNNKKSIPKKLPFELTVESWFKLNNVNSHPNSKHYLTPKSKRIKQVNEGDVTKKSFKRLHRWRYSPTACYGNNEVHLHPYKARRLSVAEVLAIQSLPKEFVLPPTMTLTNMFKGVGNGVPYLAASAIAKTIEHFLNKI